MPALLELTSEANGYATSRPVTAASNPGATIRGPACPGHGTRGAFLEHRTGRLAPSRRLRGYPFQKSREVGILLLKLRVAEVVGSKLPSFPGL